MPAFVISVNGKKVCSVGLTSENVRTIDIMWAGDPKKVEGDLICFHVGGPDENDNLRWSVPQLEVGDEITIKIANISSLGDSPTSRTPIE
jgi:hypothetical protein